MVAIVAYCVALVVAAWQWLRVFSSENYRIKGKGKEREGLRNKGLFSQTDSYYSGSLQCLLDAACFEIPNVLAL